MEIRKNPTDKKSKKQQQIVETAKKLFYHHGVKRVSVEEICKKAKVSKMTFYKYFENKMELAKYIVQLMLEEGWQKLDEVEVMSIPFPKKLKILQEYKLNYINRLSPEFIDEFMGMPFVEQERQEWFQRVMQFIESAQKRGEIRSEIRPEFILFMVDKLSEIVEDKQLKSLYSDYVELTREIWNLFYYGIVTRTDMEI